MSSVISTVKTGVGNIVTSIKDFIVGKAATIASAGQTLLNNITTNVQSVITNVTSKVGNILTKIKDKGRKLNAIADDLITQGKPNVNGEAVWTGSMVRAILLSEKYVGDVRTQKSYTADYLTHRVITNKGERVQHIIENHHEAIVDREIWNEVQLFLYNSESWNRALTTYPFTGRLHCPCGANYQRSCGQSRFKWQCGRRKQSRLLCEADGVFEDEIVMSLRETFQGKFGVGSQLDIKRLLIGLKTVQDFDNVESQRLVLKRRIAAAIGEEKESLSERLNAQEECE